MSQPIQLTIKSIIKETPDAVTLVFEQALQYKSGQFLTLEVPVNGETLHRSYSLSSSPFTGEDAAITVKKIPQGIVSTKLVDSTKIGDKIQAMAPAGVFVLEPVKTRKRDLIFIAAGSGITPLLSMIKSALKEEPLSTLYLIYGNRNESAIIGEKTLTQLQLQNPGRIAINHKLSQSTSPLYGQGRISKEYIMDILERSGSIDFAKAEAFLCGPEGLMNEAKDALTSLHLNSQNIHQEHFKNKDMEVAFGVEVNGSSKVEAQEVTIHYSGDTHQFVVPANKSILQAGLDLGIDLPYSCQSGMCTACMGKCESGKVKLHDPDGLSENEIKKGYVLTCVAQPISAGVVITIE